MSLNVKFAVLDRFGLDTEAGKPKGEWLSDWLHCCVVGAADTIGPNMSSMLLVSEKIREKIGKNLFLFLYFVLHFVLEQQNQNQSIVEWYFSENK